MNNQKKQRSLFGGSPREKEKRPRKRRTNAQIDLEKSKKKRENSTTTAKMRDNLCADRNVQPRTNRHVEDIEDSDDILDNDDNEELVDGEYDEKQSEDKTLHQTKELSIMGKFQKAIEKRIQIESNTKDPISDEEKWLFSYLKRNKFWIRKECSSFLCQKLGIPHEAEGYYKDIRVWLPDVEFKYMPHCPTCSNNDRVATHCYGEGNKTISRTVVSVSNNYSLLSRRYICHRCEKEERGQFTFRGYNSNSVNLLPKCHMLEFPAFLTKKCAMDWSLLDLMRPCFDNGMRPLAFRDMIHELHSKEYEKLALLHDFKNNENLITETKYNTPFSNYGDKMFYNGYVPGANWFRSVYILFHRTIRDHLDKEVKKRGAQIIYIDTHYKAIKTFKKLNGIPLVRGVFTVANESNEWRSQTYVTSEAHDQMKKSLTDMNATMALYGHKGPSHAFTDKPFTDKNLLLETFPSLQAQENKYVEMYNKLVQEHRRKMESNVNSDSGDSESSNSSNEESSTSDDDDDEFDDDAFLPSKILCSPVTYLKRSTDINGSIQTVSDSILSDTSIDNVMVSMDAEWYVPLNDQGRPCGAPDKLAIIQLTVRIDTKIENFVYQVRHLDNLPPMLINFLESERVIFYGVGISGDIRKINRDWGTKINEKKYIDLRHMAQTRGIECPGKGLDSLAFKVLGQSVDKSLQLSNWNRQVLSDEQIVYAANDSLKGLEIYEILEKMEDMATPLLASDIRSGLLVDISAYSGNTINLASCAAIGRICENQKWDNPNSLKVVDDAIVNGSKPGWFVVEITTLFAPSLKVQGFVQKGQRGRKYYTLGDCASAQEIFTVPLPLVMLRKHNENRQILHENKQQRKAYLQQRANAIRKIRLQSKHSAREEDVAIALDELLAGDDDAPDTNEIDGLQNITNENEIAEIENSLCAAEAMISYPGKEYIPRKGVKLDPPPKFIIDRYSAVIGSCFHVCKSVETTGDHCDNKGYNDALSEGIYCWHKEMMNDFVDAVMDKTGMSMDAVIKMRYFHRKWVARFVERNVLGPSRLYWRVRIAFETYGPRVDPETNKPLFNKRSWTSARAILKRILQGLYSDPPDLEIYKYQTKPNGEIVYDPVLHMPILKCDRDTNLLENSHKNLTNTFGHYNMGWEFADCLLAERRHRHNHRAAITNRSGYPNIGHYDTWLIDARQNRMIAKYNQLLYPQWVLASDFESTDESFGFVTLASEELQIAINSLEIHNIEFTPDVKYIAECCKLKVPPLPWNTVAEKKLFPGLLRKAQRGANVNETIVDERLCMSILRYVDGKKVFPKLPVHNRLYRKRYIFNSKVKDSCSKLASARRLIQAVNEVTGDDSAVQIEQGEDQNSNDIDNAIVEVETPNEPIITAVTQALQQHIGPKLKPKKAHKPCPIEQVDINFGAMLDMTYVGGIPMTYNHQYEATPVVATNPLPTRGPDRKQRKRRDCPICKKTKDEGCDGGRPGPIARGGHLYCMTTNRIVRSGPP
ncbi:hypothetical protein CTEN210_11921 [Chaetoceros tenuissimus]|uniref:3'-5' exonuclease n=1 Tax=Chaetoceros tenuissimus TaxID=426638 RepID=A0AAD3H9K5_9STRA|nr:hypothetical protein CTEN210_11921 [Chaetoceros tenuissimus]